MVPNGLATAADRSRPDLAKMGSPPDKGGGEDGRNVATAASN